MAKIDLNVKRPSQTCASDTRRRSKLKLGQAVEIVTGSMPMTVTDIEKNGIVRVAWCHPSGHHINYERFPEAALTAARTTGRLPRVKPEDEIPF